MRDILLTVFLLSNFVAFSQDLSKLTSFSETTEFIDIELDCIYSYKYKKDTANRFFSEEKMILQLGDGISKFYSYNNYLLDSIYEEDRNPGLIFNNISTLPKPDHRYQIFKEGKSTTSIEYILTSKYLIEEELNFNWQIKETKQVINGYPCQLATLEFAGRNYQAWFTFKIPVNDGPYKFRGLPGLIIQIEDIEGEHKFSLVQVRKSTRNMVKDTESPTYTHVTQKEFREAIQKFNPLVGLANMGIDINSLSPERKRKINQKTKRINRIERVSNLAK